MTPCFCKEIEELLVDYADGQLSTDDTNKVVSHLAECQSCQRILQELKRSLELVNVIWEDALVETETIKVPIPQKHGSLWRYATLAASILIVLGACIFWRQFAKPSLPTVTFAEIERKITESDRAARLLAAAELLSKYPEAEIIVKSQYRYIAERYPDTAAAAEVKLKIQ